MRIILGVLGSMMLTSCASVAPAPRFLAEPTVAFNPDDVAWAAKSGENTISGNALMRTVGGDAKTCAGLPVELIPEAPYARERITIIFGNLNEGYFPTSYLTAPNPDPEYYRTVRRTVCDAQGNFLFEGIPSGSYYLTASVVWQIPMQYAAMVQGGQLMQRVSVTGGETKRVVLTK